MGNNAGISIKGLKQKNQSLILKLIATRAGLWQKFPTSQK